MVVSNRKQVVAAFLLFGSILFLPEFSWSFVADPAQSYCRSKSPLPTRFQSICRIQSTTSENTDAADSIPSSEERDLRFAGVGRLYTTDQNKKQSTSETEGEEPLREGHLGVIDRLEASRVVIVGPRGKRSWKIHHFKIYF